MQAQDKISREVSDRLRYELRFKKLANAIHDELVTTRHTREGGYPLPR